MKITYTFQEHQRIFDQPLKEVVVGRPRPDAAAPDLDLSPDFTVSRPHARIWSEDDESVWIEDLGSTHGTQVNGQEIKGLGKKQLHAGDTIQAGESTLLPHCPGEPAERMNGKLFVLDGKPDFVIPTAVQAELPGKIAVTIDARDADGTFSRAGAPSDASRRLGLLYELLLQSGSVTNLDALLQTVIERVVEVIRDASRGALLLRGRDSESLLLKAFRSSEGPVVSETLARRAMREGVGFIWQRNPDDELGGSIANYRIESGMYAPLLWQGNALGVVCVDNPGGGSAFTQDDLRLLMTVAHYLAMALSHQQLQDDLRRESAIKANLLRHFSPQIAEQLLTHGTLQLSGERSEVTILVSDIRGFTNLTRDMEPIDVVELLNDYFSRLIPIIFAHNGTIDKYIGDAILAVFGSPKKDPNQHENAVRAAMAMQAEMLRSNTARASKGKVTCNIGIGIHSGEVLHGFIGAVDRMELTVIGEPVNRATRIGDGARGGEVLISSQVYQWVWKSVEVEPTIITTKHEGDLHAFRLTALKDVVEDAPQ